jgi:hypothetical protein
MTQPAIQPAAHPVPDMGLYLTAKAPAVARTVLDEEFDERVFEAVAAVMAYVNNARAVHKLADTVTMTMTVPLDPNMLDLWTAAEPILAQEYVELDWGLWAVWLLARDTAGDDFDPSPFVFPVKGEYRVRANGITLASSTKATLTPEEIRMVAARFLLAAELAEQQQEKALGGPR